MDGRHTARRAASSLAQSKNDQLTSGLNVAQYYKTNFVQNGEGEATRLLRENLLPLTRNHELSGSAPQPLIINNNACDWISDGVVDDRRDRCDWGEESRREGSTMRVDVRCRNVVRHPEVRVVLAEIERRSHYKTQGSGREGAEICQKRSFVAAHNPKSFNNRPQQSSAEPFALHLKQECPRGSCNNFSAECNSGTVSEVISIPSPAVSGANGRPSEFPGVLGVLGVLRSLPKTQEASRGLTTTHVGTNPPSPTPWLTIGGVAREGTLPRLSSSAGCKKKKEKNIFNWGWNGTRQLFTIVRMFLRVTIVEAAQSLNVPSPVHVVATIEHGGERKGARCRFRSTQSRWMKE